MLLLLAAALPRLFWDGGPATAATLREAGISQIVTTAANAGSWNGVQGITVETGEFANREKLAPPMVNYRPNQASASNSPWIDANGWQFLRHPDGRFAYDVKGVAAGLAAAEAYSYAADALIRSDAAGLKPLGEMLGFLRGLGNESMAGIADIGFVDDGTEDAGEAMNLMSRNNLLYQVVRAPDRKFKLTVKLGTKEYSAEDAKDPSRLAHIIRGNLTDDKRAVRIFGTQVVLARLTGTGGHMRVHLLNYAGANRKVEGVRVRVLGRYTKHSLAAAGSPGEELLDFMTDKDATEFTLPELKTYAVIDLTR